MPVTVVEVPSRNAATTMMSPAATSSGTSNAGAAVDAPNRVPVEP
jgi:hypothetical protein